MFKTYVADHLEIEGRTTVAGRGGFTAADLISLGEVEATAITRHIWGRAQFVSNEFAHYLAAWSTGASTPEPPALAVARFKKTGTYMLMIGTTVVASGRSLSDVLPALPAMLAPRGDRAAATSSAAD